MKEITSPKQEVIRIGDVVCYPWADRILSGKVTKIREGEVKLEAINNKPVHQEWINVEHLTLVK